MTLSEDREVLTEPDIIQRTDVRRNVPFMIVAGCMAGLMLLAGVFSLGGRQHTAKIAFGPVTVDTNPNHPGPSRNPSSDRS